ncbi:hypothetical protein Bca52824_034700 [Brassica carinata]|uniref:Reverse transcriptase zinc-binding domain-containing protein n=1 Tax=Brassica carinata TaxID=52824 RepID=A0A8X7S1S3_BRACI|nr:hypothetical protein Bca52824_034700 [Brassica carinata]
MGGLTPRSAVKDWAKLIWFSGAIPRQAFNMWLANLNRLPTKVRMASWGLNVQTACCFCSNHEESREHLFLTCSYTDALWRLIFARLDRHHAPLISWSELLSSPLNLFFTTFGDSATQQCISTVLPLLQQPSASSTGISTTL